jgi:hypothetical protein
MKRQLLIAAAIAAAILIAAGLKYRGLRNAPPPEPPPPVFPFKTPKWGVYELDPLKCGETMPAHLPVTWCLVTDLWGGIEAEEGKFDFSRLDKLVDVAHQRGWKAIVRVIGCGRPHPEWDFGYLETPEWVVKKGKTINYKDWREPIYWDPWFQEKWIDVQRRVIQHFGNDDRLWGYFLSHHEWGEISNFWDRPEILEQYPKYGYTREKLLQSIFHRTDALIAARDKYARDKILMQYGYGLCDHEGWSTPNADKVADRYMTKPLVAWGTMQLSEAGLADKQVAAAARRTKRTRCLLVLMEDHPCRNISELRNKLRAARPYAPDAICLNFATWNLEGAAAAIADYEAGRL